VSYDDGFDLVDAILDRVDLKQLDDVHKLIYDEVHTYKIIVKDDHTQFFDTIINPTLVRKEPLFLELMKAYPTTVTKELLRECLEIYGKEFRSKPKFLDEFPDEWSESGHV
jgi:hypothetical protein